MNFNTQVPSALIQGGVVSPNTQQTVTHQTDNYNQIKWQCTPSDSPFQISIKPIKYRENNLRPMLYEETSLGKFPLFFKTYSYRLHATSSQLSNYDNYELYVKNNLENEAIKDALVIKRTKISNNSLKIDFTFNSKIPIVSFKTKKTKEFSTFNFNLKAKTKIASRITSLFESKNFIIRVQPNSGSYNTKIDKKGELQKVRKHKTLLKGRSSKTINKKKVPTKTSPLIGIPPASFSNPPFPQTLSDTHQTHLENSSSSIDIPLSFSNAPFPQTQLRLRLDLGDLNYFSNQDYNHRRVDHPTYPQPQQPSCQDLVSRPLSMPHVFTRVEPNPTLPDTRQTPLENSSSSIDIPPFSNASFPQTRLRLRLDLGDLSYFSNQDYNHRRVDHPTYPQPQQTQQPSCQDLVSRPLLMPHVFTRVEPSPTLSDTHQIPLRNSPSLINTLVSPSSTSVPQTESIDFNLIESDFSYLFDQDNSHENFTSSPSVSNASQPHSFEYPFYSQLPSQSNEDFASKLSLMPALITEVETNPTLSNTHQAENNNQFEWQSTFSDSSFQIDVNRKVRKTTWEPIAYEETSIGKFPSFFKIYTYRIHAISSQFSNYENYELHLKDSIENKVIKDAMVIKKTEILNNSIKIEFTFNSKIPVMSFKNKQKKDFSTFNFNLKAQTKIDSRITSLLESKNFIVRRQPNSGKYSAKINEKGLLQKEVRKRKIKETSDTSIKKRSKRKTHTQNLESHPLNTQDSSKDILDDILLDDTLLEEIFLEVPIASLEENSTEGSPFLNDVPIDIFDLQIHATESGSYNFFEEDLSDFDFNEF